MFSATAILLILAVGGSRADISGQEPAMDQCLCVYLDPLNVRDAACGNQIGTAYNGQCYRYKGYNQWCDLSGTNFHFFMLDFNGVMGWAAGSFLQLGSEEQCGGGEPVNDYYTCETVDQGTRYHEALSPTPYDCVDSSCGNSCLGGQCVAYVKCRCTRPGTTANRPPSTSCWRPGAKVSVNGICNRDIPANTAIATFDGNGFYTYHTGVFMGCTSDTSIDVWDQWCCQSVQQTVFTPDHSYYDTFYVVTSNCGDSAAECRVESPGGSCCQICEGNCVSCFRGRHWGEATGVWKDVN